MQLTRYEARSFFEQKSYMTYVRLLFQDKLQTVFIISVSRISCLSWHRFSLYSSFWHLSLTSSEASAQLGGRTYFRINVHVKYRTKQRIHLYAYIGYSFGCENGKMKQQKLTLRAEIDIILHQSSELMMPIRCFDINIQILYIEITYYSA